jgi:hypothetical protein
MIKIYAYGLGCKMNVDNTTSWPSTWKLKVKDLRFAVFMAPIRCSQLSSPPFRNALVVLEIILS